MYRETPFFGQIGAIYLFEDSISIAQIQSMYNLGPNYLGCFQPDRFEYFIFGTENYE